MYKRQLVASLLCKGYLAKDEEFGVLSLAEKAYETFRDKSTITARVVTRARLVKKDKTGSPVGAVAGAGAKPATGTYPSDSREAALEVALRALRRRLAEAGRVPNYMIFSDRTLYDLIAKVPSSQAALLEVFGMGEVKAKRFGRELLETMETTPAG